MEPSHRRIIMNPKLLHAVIKGNERSFARFVGLHDEDIEEITFDAPNDGIASNEPDFFLGVTYTGNSLLHLAARSDFLGLAEKIWLKERSLLAARNKVLDTPLHIAARNGNCDMVSLFVGFAKEMGDDVMKEVLRARNKDGETALHEAARHNHSRIVNQLLSVDLGLASVVDDQEMSPMFLAAMSGFRDVVHELVQRLKEIEAKDLCTAYYSGPKGQTVLHAAVLTNKGKTKINFFYMPVSVIGISQLLVTL